MSHTIVTPEAAGDYVVRFVKCVLCGGGGKRVQGKQHNHAAIMVDCTCERGLRMSLVPLKESELRVVAKVLPLEPVKPAGHVYDFPRPALTVDVIVTRPGKQGDEILLIERCVEPFAGMWALPGGFVGQGETLEAAAARELMEETGVKWLPGRQVGAFGDPDRDPRGWVVSVAYAFEVMAGTEATAGDDAEKVRWCLLSDLPPLAFDHTRIIERFEKAREAAA